MSGFINSSNGCALDPGSGIICNNMTNICQSQSTNEWFCEYRTQTYDNITNTCNSLFAGYCQNGTLSSNEKGYNCSCPPGSSLDLAFNCASKEIFF